MPVSMMSPTRVITIFSLVALCILSFTVLFGSNYNLDTPTRDTLVHDSPFSLPKSNVVHQRRALHHARATTLLPVSESILSPSQSAATQASTEPFSSPSPSSSSQPSATQDNSSSAPSSARATSTPPSTSAASSSSAVSSSSTLSPSSSLSSSAQASSSSSVIRSTVAATSSLANSPTTSLTHNPVSFTLSGTRPTNPGSTVSMGATPGVGAGATSGFFNNKAAVGVTFSIVGILGGLAVIMTVLTIMKRHRRGRRGRRYAMEDEDFFEKYPSSDPNEPGPHLPPGFGSAEASITDFNMSAAPTDAYPDRAVHYGQSNAGAVLDPVDYGIAYPPGAAHNDDSTPAIRSNMNEESGSEYSMPSTAHPFADPANTSVPTAAPPVTSPRPFAGRAHEMVTTDSYYGPNSAGVGAGVGYAQ